MLCVFAQGKFVMILQEAYVWLKKCIRMHINRKWNEYKQCEMGQWRNGNLMLLFVCDVCECTWKIGILYPQPYTTFNRSCKYIMVKYEHFTFILTERANNNEISWWWRSIIFGAPANSCHRAHALITHTVPEHWRGEQCATRYLGSGGR